MNRSDAAYVGAVEQQHSARTGQKGPGQAQGQGHGQAEGQEPGKKQGQKRKQKQGKGPRRRKGSKPRPAAAAAVPVKPAASPLSPAPGPASASPKPPRRTGVEAAGPEAAALYHAQLRFPLIPARLTDALSWLPRARLTALGTGLLAVLVMVLTGWIDRLLLGSSVTFYGGVFIVTSMVCAGWVRPADLYTAPVAAPLAFTAGLFFISGGAGTEGFMGHLTSLFPALAVNAVWLYAGTLLAALVALVRKVGLVVQRSRARALLKAQDEAEADLL